MNTANLQHEGLLLALASLLDLLERKGVASREELDAALAEAEERASSDPRRPSEVSASNVDAICFPIRFLRLALSRPSDLGRGFSDVASAVGLSKPGHR